MQKIIKKTTIISAISVLTPGSTLSNQMMQGYKDDHEFRSILDGPQEPFVLKNGLLYKDNKLFIPKGYVRNKILYDYHSTPSSGHLGEVKTRHKIYPLYYWKDFRAALSVLVALVNRPSHVITNHLVF